jgi:hypothetical protein
MSPSSSDSLKEEVEEDSDNSSAITDIEDSLSSSKKHNKTTASSPGVLKGKRIIKKLKTNCKDVNVECKKSNSSSCCVEHIFSFGLFVIYCLLRSLFIYEIFIVFKYSNDILFVITIFFEAITICIWIFTLLMLTFKKDWSFKLRNEFKLLYWNWLYQNFGHKSRHSPPSPPSTINLTHTDAKSTIKVDSNLESKAKEALSENNKACLLVRDDSVLMNRSANLSSSSITEVSSLMPSSGNKLLDGSFSSNHHKQQSGNILNATNLSETIMQLDDEESNYKRLTLNNRSNRSSKIIYENSNNMMAPGAAPFFFSEQEILAPISYASRHSMRSNAVSKVQTIGEIMEPPLPPANRTVTISQINDSSASSFASTGDSGRDSIESPINNNNNTNNTTSKPFIIGMHGVSSSSNALLEQQNQMNQNAFYLNQSQNNYNSNGQTILKLTQSSHLLDTRC